MWRLTLKLITECFVAAERTADGWTVRAKGIFGIIGLVIILLVLGHFAENLKLLLAP